MKKIFTSSIFVNFANFAKFATGYFARVAAVLLLLVMSTSAWGSAAHFNLIGQLNNNNWNGNETSKPINTSTGNDSEYYIELEINAGTYYFALNNGSTRYQSSTTSRTLVVNGSALSGTYNSDSDKAYLVEIVQDGTYRIIVNQSTNEWYPTVKITCDAPETLYTVTVVNGTPTSVDAGSTTKPTITANDPVAGKRFDRWTTTGGASVTSETSATTTVSATAAGTVTANYADVANITIYFYNDKDWTTVKVHKWGGSAAGTSWPGVDATLESTINGHKLYSVTFAEGEYGQLIFNNNDKGSQTNNIPVSGRTDAKPCVHITTDRNFEWIAVPTPAEYTGLTVSQTTGGASAPEISANHVVQGGSVDVRAGAAAAGYQWDGWTSTNGTFDNALEMNTTFTPTANNAEAVANYVATAPQWELYKQIPETKLGTFTENAGVYTLNYTFTGSEGALQFRYGSMGCTPPAESLVTFKALANNSGWLPWQDGAGEFNITIKNDGGWKIKAEEASAAPCTPTSYELWSSFPSPGVKIGDFEGSAGTYTINFLLDNDNRNNLFVKGIGEDDCVVRYNGNGSNFNNVGTYVTLTESASGTIQFNGASGNTNYKLTLTTSDMKLLAGTGDVGVKTVSAEIENSNRTTDVVGLNFVNLSTTASEGYTYEFYELNTANTNDVKGAALATGVAVTNTEYEISSDRVFAVGTYYFAVKVTNPNTTSVWSPVLTLTVTDSAPVGETYYVYLGQTLTLDAGPTYTKGTAAPAQYASSLAPLTTDTCTDGNVLSGNTYQCNTLGRFEIEGGASTIVVYVYRYYAKHPWGSCETEANETYRKSWVWRGMNYSDNKVLFTGTYGKVIGTGFSYGANLAWDYAYDWDGVYQLDGSESGSYCPGDKWMDETDVSSGTSLWKNFNLSGTCSVDLVDHTYTNVDSVSTTAPTLIEENYLFAINSTVTKYTLTFASVTNGTLSETGGKVSSTLGATSPVTVADGTEIEVNAVANSGYTFAGWYSEPECTNRLTEETVYAITVNADKAVYAKFEQSCPSGFKVCGMGSWEESARKVMTKDPSDCVFTYTYENLVAGNYEFAFLNGDTWYKANTTGLNYASSTHPLGDSGETYHNLTVSIPVKGNLTITLTYNSASEIVVDAVFAPAKVYVVGRFKVQDGSDNYTYTGASDGNWVDNSTNIEMLYNSISGVYELNTHCTVGELSAEISSTRYYFHFRYGGVEVGSTTQNIEPSLNEAPASANTANGTKNFLFNRAEKTWSDVTLHWNPTANKLWYTVTVPTRSVGVAYVNCTAGTIQVQDNYDVAEEFSSQITAPEQITFNEVTYTFATWAIGEGVTKVGGELTDRTISVTATQGMLGGLAAHYIVPFDLPATTTYYVYAGHDLNLPGNTETENYTYSGSGHVTAAGLYHSDEPRVSHFTQRAESKCSGIIYKEQAITVNCYKHYIKYPNNGEGWKYYGLTDNGDGTYYRKIQYGGSGVNIISETSVIPDGTEDHSVAKSRYYHASGGEDDCRNVHKEASFNNGDDVYVIFNELSTVDNYKTKGGRVDFVWADTIILVYDPTPKYTDIAMLASEANTTVVGISSPIETLQYSTDGETWNDWTTFTPTSSGTYFFRDKVTGTNAVGQTGPFYSNVVEVEIVVPSIELTVAGSTTVGGDVDLTITTNISATEYTFSVTAPGESTPVQIYRGSEDHVNDYTCSMVGTYTFHVAATDGTRIVEDEKMWTITTSTLYLRYSFLNGDNSRERNNVPMTYNPVDGTYYYYQTTAETTDWYRPISSYDASWSTDGGKYGWVGSTNVVEEPSEGWLTIENPESLENSVTPVIFHYDQTQNKLWITGAKTSYRVKSAGTNGTFFSNVIKGAGNTISFYASTDATLTWQRSDNGLDGWTDSVTFNGGTKVSSNDIYVCTPTAIDETAQMVTPYTGVINVYSVAFGTNALTKFTTTTYYDHYFVEWAETGENVGATMGNSINTNISSVLSQYSVPVGTNVRYEYKAETNRFTRTLIGGSSGDEFINIYGDHVTKTDEAVIDSEANSLKLTDGSNWVYTADIKAEMGGSDAKVTLVSTYNSQKSWILAADGSQATAEANKVVVVGKSTTNGTYNLRLIYDYKTNKITAGWLGGNVTGDKTIDADFLVIRKDIDTEIAGPTIINLTAPDSVLSLNNVVTLFEMRREHFYDGSKNWKIDDNHYYWFSLPYDCKISDIYGWEGYGTKWWIEEYLGDARAAISWFDFIPTWWSRMYLSGTMLANVGYVIYVNPAYDDFKTIGDKALLTLYFPSSTAEYTIAANGTKNVDVPAHTCSVTSPQDRRVFDSDWNVIGVPGYMDAKLNSAFQYCYKWNSVNSYTVTDVTTSTVFKPTFAYMVQYHGTLVWNTGADLSWSAAPSRQSASVMSNRLCLQLVDGDGEMRDQTYVTLTPEGSEAYDMGDDLLKIFSASASHIYTTANNICLAANDLNDTTTVVPVGTQLKDNDMYAFHMSQSIDGVTPYLYDAELGIYTNLLVDDYYFTAEMARSTGRFYLVFGYQAPSTPTGVDSGSVDSDGGGGPQKFIRNGVLYILNNGKLYNANGSAL